MRSMVRRVGSILTLFSIIGFGMFKNHIKAYIASIIQKYFHTDPISVYLNELSKNAEWDKDIIAWILYYPAYLLLHILFIYLLFYKEERWRNGLIAALIIFIVMDSILIIFFKVMHFHALYGICYHLIQNLFGLPFILLAIEGGRHLFKELIS